jgi:hypothetical protein
MLRRSSPLMLAVILGLVLTWSVCAGGILRPSAPTAHVLTGPSFIDTGSRASNEGASAAMVRLDRRDQVGRPDDRATWLFVALAVLARWRLRRRRGLVSHGGARGIIRWLGLARTSRGPPLGWNVRGRATARPIASLSR